MCACGLVGNISGKVTDTYADQYFTVEDPTSGHRNFDSEWSREYDLVRFTQELDELVGPPRGTCRLLDFGSATGTFLELAQQRGWQTIGLEPSASARSIARAKAQQCVRQLEDLPTQPAFEIVTLHHVLEHLEKPVHTLAALARVLVPTGRLIVEVPNWASWERHAMRDRWIDLRPEQHRWHFDPHTLDAVCHEAGLRIEQIGTRGEPLPTPRSILASLGFKLPTTGRGCRGGCEQSERGVAGRYSGIRLVVPPFARTIDRALHTFLAGKRLYAVTVPSAEAL